MLCGCTITSIRSISIPNNQRASIISRPLLNIVEESIVIFLPISHVGWFSACSTVTFSNSSTGVLRNGPPDAVRIKRETSRSPPWCPLRHCQMALCSLSTGRILTPFSAAAVITISPAITRISLLATARSFPASIAAIVGSNPAVPTMATSTISASAKVATSSNPSAPT